MLRSKILPVLACLAIACGAHLAAAAIALHPDHPRYFIFRGQPTVLITSGEHYGAVSNLDFNYITYLNTLQAAGLNMTRIFAGTNAETWGGNLNTLNPAPGRFSAAWARSGTPGYADGGNKFNLNQFDPAYWSRLRDFVQQASNRGIVVEYTLFNTSYDDGDWSVNPMNAANNVNGTVTSRNALWTDPGIIAYQDALARKAVSELSGFDNVIYELCNEPYWGVFPSASWHAHLAQVIAAADTANRHLIAQNIANGSTTLGGLLPNISIYNYHYCFPPDAVAFNYGLNRPIGFDENGFRGNGSDPYRQEAWAFLLNGGATYDGLDWSFTVASPNGQSTGSAVPDSGGNATLRAWLGVLKNFMGSIDFVHMTRNPGIITGGNPGSAWALSNATTVAVYVLGGSQANLVLNLPASSWRAEWVDTRSGGIMKTETFSHSGGNRTISSPSYNQDIALRVISTGPGLNNAPSVSLTSPVNGSTFSAPANIALSANASDTDGTISKVDFYRDSTLIGTDTTSPYSVMWSIGASGTYSLTARATDNSGAVTTSSAVIVTIGAGGGQTPFGSPMAVPGTINTAQYDNGGEGVAYHDIDSQNRMSSSYRPGEGVDSNGAGVGWVSATEWLEYTVNVSATGNYTMAISVSHPGNGGTMHVSVGGVNVTGSLTLPNTGSWDNYQNIIAPVNLTGGTQILQVAFDTSGSTGYGPGLGNIVISSAGGTGPTPFNGTPMAVPGTINTAQYDNGGEGVAYHDVDAANLASSTYRSGQGVDSNGAGVGWISASEWLDYTVNVSTAGTYQMAIPVSHPGTGGTMHVSFNGVNKTGSLGLPNTGSWSTFQNINATVNLVAGTQIMTVFFDTNGSTGYGPGLGNIVISSGPTLPTQTPYTGTPIQIPGTLVVSQYDNGGEGVAYHDNEASNLMSSSYRPGLGVDANGSEVGWVYAGEWIEYTVNVATAGTYTMTIPMSNAGTGGTFHINFNDVNKSGTITVPATGSWSTYQNATASVNLNAGQQVMRISWDSNGSTGAICGLHDIIIASGSAGPTQTPFNGAPMAIPGTINVSQYDNGGEGVAYHDDTTSNLKSSSYRPGLAVDADGTEVGWTNAGEWIEYTVNVSTAGAYTLTIPMSNAGTGGTFHINFGGVNKTGTLNVPATGNWGVFQNATATVNLSAGVQVMAISWDTNGSTGSVCGLHNIAISVSPPAGNG